MRNCYYEEMKNVVLERNPIQGCVKVARNTALSILLLKEMLNFSTP